MSSIYVLVLRSPRVSAVLECPFDVYSEDSKAININLLSSYLEVINLEPDDLGS
jgi:hypothetical protein